MNTHEIKIYYVEAHRQINNLEKVIHKVHFEYKAINENGKSAVIMKEVNLPSVDAASFIPFDQITKDQVTEWIKPLIDEESLKIESDEELQNRLYPQNLILEINN